MAAEADRQPELDARLLEIAEAAADRWAARGEVRRCRAEAIAQGNYLAADSPERLALRIDRLLSGVRQAAQTAREPSGVLLNDLAEAPPITVDQLTNDLIHEALIGARDFLSSEFLDRGVAAARTVGRLVVRTVSGPRGWGTGFLIAPGLMLTNNHVLASRAFAATCAIEMDYALATLNAGLPYQTFALEPERLFLTSQPLDYTVVAVAAASDHGKLLANYGYCPLDRRQGKIAMATGDFLNIVQHPLGRAKEVVLRDNRVLDLRARSDEAAAAQMAPFIHYEGDTEKGSSGSPVFNDQWEVIALHHSGVPRRSDTGKILTKDAREWVAGVDPVERIDWIGNEGLRVSSLIADLERAMVSAEERTLLDAVLTTPLSGAAPVAGPTRESLGAAVELAWAGGRDPVTIQVPLLISIGLNSGVKPS